MANGGDYASQYIVNPAMIARVEGQEFGAALDACCGEGRFCRMLGRLGVTTIGIDPTEDLIRHAWEQHPDHDYRVGRAEALPLPDLSCDLVVSYLTLIDIPEIAKAIAQVVRVLRPGGTLLIANRASFNTAGAPEGWVRDESGNMRFFFDYCLKERANWVTWRDVRVRK
jgi:ubiquinone/menaquinone biosynthesis C-methylase UbiE